MLRAYEQTLEPMRQRHRLNKFACFHCIVMSGICRVDAITEMPSQILPACVVYRKINHANVGIVLDMDNGKTIPEISVHLGMKPEEVFRLSNFTREDFLKLMLKDEGYSNAEIITSY